MPNATSPFVEQRVVAFALGQPGFGPARIAAELARPKWGGIKLSPSGVWRVLRRHGLNTGIGCQVRRVTVRRPDHERIASGLGSGGAPRRGRLARSGVHQNPVTERPLTTESHAPPPPRKCTI